MTAPAQHARRFVPIFRAKITPASVSKRVGKNGEYSLMQGATVETAKGSKQMTVMAFGSAHQQVNSKLRKGRTIELAVQFDGSTLKVIGLPHDKAA